MKKVCERIHNKVRYDGFSPLEVKYIKTVKEYDRVERELNQFYGTCKRKTTGHVDWELINEKELDYFDYIYKKSNTLLKRKSKYEEQIHGDEVMRLFMELNINSISY